MTRTLLAIVTLISLPLSSAMADSWGASAVEENGVRVVVNQAEYDDDELDLTLTVYNQSGDALYVPLNQIAVAVPGKPALYDDDSAVRTINPGANSRFEFNFEADDDFEDFGGVFVRFDGLYRGGQVIRIAPMKVGSPRHSPGDFKNMTMPAAARGASGSGSSPAYVPSASAPTASPSSPPPSSGTGLQQFTGSRARLKTPGVRVAAIPLKASGVPKDIAFIMDELLLAELQNAGFEAIGPDDINAMVGFEGMKDKMGCDDTSCVAEIGNALGVPYLVAGSVAKLEGSVVLTIKLIDVPKTKVAARVSKITEGDTKVLPKVIAEATVELVTKSGL